MKWGKKERKRYEVEMTTVEVEKLVM